MQFMIQEPKRVAFMGTPQFAVPSLSALLDHAPRGRLWASGLDIVGVITRPDKPAGRGRTLGPSPVKQFALAKGLPVYQPGSLKRKEALDLIHSLRPNIIIVVAFGQILPPPVLEYPINGCLNVHASLLPRHRGASPIAAAILAGDKQTGVTIMEMEEGLDTGPIIAQISTPIMADENAGQLSDRLAELGAGLLVATLPLWLAGGIETIAQDESKATMTRTLRKEDGWLDWTRDALELDLHVRAYTPWPGAFTRWGDRILKIARAHPVSDNGGRQPGDCFTTGEGKNRSLAVACGSGALVLEVVQLQGKRAMPSADLLRGHPSLASARLGPTA